MKEKGREGKRKKGKEIMGNNYKIWRKTFFYTSKAEQTPQTG